jgi:hypothetical protein
MYYSVFYRELSFTILTKRSNFLLFILDLPEIKKTLITIGLKIMAYACLFKYSIIGDPGWSCL